MERPGVERSGGGAVLPPPLAAAAETPAGAPFPAAPPRVLHGPSEPGLVPGAETPVSTPLLPGVPPYAAPPSGLPAMLPGALAAATPDRAAFLAFVADDNSEAALRGGLSEMIASQQIRRGTARTAARVLERESTPRALLVDVSGLDDAFAALEELASVCTPDVRVVVIGENTEISFYRRLIRDVGVTEYIHKPLTRDTALHLIGPLLFGGEAVDAASRGGRVIAVAGVRGGVGATTVAVSLAIEIAETTRGHVALLDLHLRGGATGIMLGVRPTSGFRIALEEPERADPLFLDRVAIPIDERLRLIAAEEPLEAEPRPTEEGTRRVLALLRQRFNHIVVDLPMPPHTAERAVLSAARHCALVLAPDVASIRDTVAARRMVAALGGTSRAVTVLNRVGQPGGIPTRLVTEGLGMAPDVAIPDLPRQVPRASNLGRPAVRETSALRRALAPLIQEVTALPAARAPRSLVSRLLGRSRT
jgi:pilus assembly protein CpaE